MRSQYRLTLLGLIVAPAALFGAAHDYQYGTMAYYNEAHREAAFQKEMSHYSRISPPKPIDLSTPAPKYAVDEARQRAMAQNLRENQEAALRYMARQSADTRSPFQRQLDAANAGDAGACWNLAQILLNGREGQARNPERAVYWFERAAKLGGDAAAMRWLGRYEENAYPDLFGPHAPNLPKAAEWYRQAAERGDEDAMEWLGLALLEGRGVKTDIAAARPWLKRVAALGGHTWATEKYYELLMASLAPADHAEAIAALRREVARPGGESSSLALLADLLLREPNGAQVNHDEIVRLMEQARSRGSDAALYFAQLIDSERFGPRQPAEAVALYEKLRTSMDLETSRAATVRLADHLAAGDGVPRDLARAGVLFASVPSFMFMADGAAGLRYAFMLRDGQGVAEDAAKAYSLFRDVARAKDLPKDVRGQAAAEAVATLITHPEFSPADASGLVDLLATASETQPEIYTWAALQEAQRAKRGVNGRRDLHAALKFAEYGASRGIPSSANLAAEYLWEMNEDNTKAMQYTRSAAEHGFPHAWATLGSAYAQGRGDGEKDFARARECYEKGIAAGDPAAKGGLANLKADGAGTPKDIPGAMKLFREAAPYDLIAASNLGEILWTGEFGEKDVAEGAHWQQRAADGGDWIACVAYARAVHLGVGAAKDEAVKQRYLARAGEVGDMYTWRRLGVLLLEGDQIGSDIPAARGWLEKAAAGGARNAPGMLCRLYRTGALGKVDLDAARRYAEAGVAHQDDNAAIELALLTLQTKPKDEAAAKEAVDRLEQFDTQDVMIREVLADCYERGVGTERDDEVAQRLRKEAKALRAKLKSPSAIYVLQ